MNSMFFFVFLKNELLNNHKQMQKDVQLYQSQIEAGKANYKKMQADLQKELQSVFQENTRLNLLMEGKVPKGTILFKLMIFFFSPSFFFFSPFEVGDVGKIFCSFLTEVFVKIKYRDL